MSRHTHTHLERDTADWLALERRSEELAGRILRRLALVVGIALCVAGAVQSWYAPAMLLYVPGVALVVAATARR